MVLFSDRGTPKSVRYMNSYSGHTYKFTKAVSNDDYQMLMVFNAKVMARMARLNMRKFTSKLSKGYKISAAKKLPKSLERTLII
jgi:catalase